MFISIAVGFSQRIEELDFALVLATFSAGYWAKANTAIVPHPLAKVNGNS